MRTYKQLAAAAFLAILPAGAALSRPAPNVALEVSYQQRADGKLGEGIHIMHLDCWEGACSLVVVTLNQCMGGKSFSPKIETASTQSGDLKVVSPSDGVLLVEQNIDAGLTLAKFRFEYIPDRRHGFSTVLAKFSGSFVKNSDILGKVISWETVGLEGRFVERKPLCNFMLAGVPSEEDRRFMVPEKK